MTSFVQAVAVAAVLTVPTVSFAQSNEPLTRAEVRAQLAQFEKAAPKPPNQTSLHKMAHRLATAV
jgi:hypothetical protein